MKKKILLMALMVVAVIALFAISAFAEGIIVSKTESEEYGTVIQLSEDPGLDAASDYVSTLNKINDAGTDGSALCILTDGTYFYVFPSSYVVNEESYLNYSNQRKGLFDITATDLATAMADFNTANGTNYYAEYTIASSGGDKRLEAIVRFEFPTDVTYAHASYACMRSYPNLVEVKINHDINFSSAEKMFYRNAKLAAVIGFENVDGTKLAKTMFASCSALRYIKLPANTTKIPGSFFQGAKGVVVVDIENLTQLTTICSWAFDGTKNLNITLPDSVTTLETSAFESAFNEGGSLTINPTSQLTTIGGKAFRASSKLTSFYIPSTVTSIGNNAFESCGATVFENFENCQITKLGSDVFLKASVETIKIPSTVTEIGAAFSQNSNLKLVYIPKEVITIADTFTGTAENIVFLYTGTDKSVISSCATLANAHSIEPTEYKTGVEYTGVNLVIGYSNCVAYGNGIHANEIIDVVVTSYTEKMTKLNRCTLCGMVENGDTIPALFIYVGCSTPLDGRGEITIGFVPNYEAIETYEEITGKSLSFGVFAAEKNNLGASDIFDKDGNTPANIINADLTDIGCAMFDLRIVGFNTPELKSVQLAMGAYVAASKDGQTQYSYLQESAPSANEKYYFISYNDVANR